jgi:hypothetical protein
MPRTTDRGNKLARLEDATVFDGGATVAFTITTVNRKQLRVNCPLAELGDIFSYLGILAKNAGAERKVPMPPLPQSHNYLAPVPAEGIAFQAGTQPDETLLLMRLSGFDMAFSVSRSGLIALADEIRRIALTLSAESEKPQ